MKIGNLTLAGKAALAPMAGVTDQPFRELCVSFGAAYVVTEMVSSKGLQFQDRKSGELMAVSQGERPAAIQLFGDDPQIMAAAARKSPAPSSGRNRYQYGLPGSQGKLYRERFRPDEASPACAGRLLPQSSRRWISPSR